MGDLKKILEEYWADKQITLEERLSANEVARKEGLSFGDMFKIEQEVLKEIVDGFPEKEPLTEEITDTLKRFVSITKEKKGATKFAEIISYLFIKKGRSRLPDHLAYLSFAKRFRIPPEKAYVYLVRKIENL